MYSNSFPIVYSLQDICKRNLNKVIIGHLNVWDLKLLRSSILISEIKLDNSLSKGQLFIDGYSTPSKLGWNAPGDDILYLKEHIKMNLLSKKFQKLLDKISIDEDVFLLASKNELICVLPLVRKKYLQLTSRLVNSIQRSLWHFLLDM